MRGQAAARMKVTSRREPLPLKEVERRLESGQKRALTLHCAGYTEESFKEAQSRRDRSRYADWWAKIQATFPELQRKSIWRKLARGKRARIHLWAGEHPVEQENSRKARERGAARAIEMTWRWRRGAPDAD